MCEKLLFLLMVACLCELSSQSYWATYGSSWMAAKSECENEGGMMVVIDSQSKQDDVAANVKAMLDPSKAGNCLSADWPQFGHAFYIAGKRTTDSCQGEFDWFAPGGAQTRMDYAYWAPAEPDCAWGDQFCVVLATSDAYNYHWAAHECSVLLCAICESI